MTPRSGAAAETMTARARPVLRWLLTVVVVVGIFVGVLPRIASYSDVWATISDMSWLEVTSLLLIAIWNLVTYWLVLVAALPGLRYGQAAMVTQASTAVANTLPAGAALGVGMMYAMLSSWGFAPATVARSLLVTGVWNNYIKLGFPVIALALLTVGGDVSAALVVASLIGLAVLAATILMFALLLRSDHLARSLGDAAGRLTSRLRRSFRRPPVTGWGRSASRFRADTVELVTSRWLNLTAATLVSHLTLAVVLLVAVRSVGLSQEQVSWVTVLASFAFVRLISALPITPGGVGVVELGYVAALSIGLDQSERTSVVAAVLVFRFLTYVLPIPLGALAYAFWRTGRGRRRGPASPPGRRASPETTPEAGSGVSGSGPGNS